MKTQKTLNLHGVIVAVTAKPNAEYAFWELLPLRIFCCLVRLLLAGCIDSNFGKQKIIFYSFIKSYLFHFVQFRTRRVSFYQVSRQRKKEVLLNRLFSILVWEQKNTRRVVISLLLDKFNINDLVNIILLYFIVLIYCFCFYCYYIINNHFLYHFIYNNYNFQCYYCLFFYNCHYSYHSLNHQ